MNHGSCVRLRPERANHGWSYDFVSARTHDGRTLRLLTLIDECTRECLAIRVARRRGSAEVLETLAEVMLWHRIPEYIRSDNGPAFIAKELRQWLLTLGTGTLYIEPGSPWENGYCESFNLPAAGRWEAEGRMPEGGDLLLTAGGADCDRTVAGRVQHPATALGARLQAAGTVGLQPLGSTKSSFTAPGCDVDSQCAWYKISVRSIGPNRDLVCISFSHGISSFVLLFSALSFRDSVIYCIG